MKTVTVGIARTYLRTASAAAMLLQGSQLLSISMFGTSEAVFETLRFRLLAAVIIIAFVGLARLCGYLAYAHTMAASTDDAHGDFGASMPRWSRTVLRYFFLMHFRFTGRIDDVTDWHLAVKT
ncbi:hypothetical protein [Caballeronia zhejiangensis]|uniref:hypothetical protein n=1 Tax=Caballeronia zhejiangensis TaxID=871203 RepID=UPI001FD005C2|nr:hypothetical protein [Caballeronia zhejiangensis]